MGVSLTAFLFLGLVAIASGTIDAHDGDAKPEHVLRRNGFRRVRDTNASAPLTQQQLVYQYPYGGVPYAAFAGLPVASYVPAAFSPFNGAPAPGTGAQPISPYPGVQAVSPFAAQPIPLHYLQPAFPYYNFPVRDDDEEYEDVKKPSYNAARFRFAPAFYY